MTGKNVCARAVLMIVMLGASLAVADGQATARTTCAPGQICKAGKFRAGDGTCALPAYSYLLDPDTGFTRPGANEQSVCVNATRSFKFSGTPGVIEGIDNSSKLTLNNVTGTQLTYGAVTFTCDSNTCAAAPASDTYVLRSTTGFGSGVAPGNGTAFASFPACNAARSGPLRFDSTSVVWRSCNGSIWRPIVRDTSLSGFMPAGVTGAADLVAAQSLFTFIAAPSRIDGVVVVGGGVGAGTFTLEIFDATTATVLCTSSATNCTAVAGTTFSAGCADTYFAAEDVLRVRLQSAGCTSTPAINVTARFR